MLATVLDTALYSYILLLDTAIARYKGFCGIIIALSEFHSINLVTA